MSLKDFFGKLSRDQGQENDDLNMDYSDFYSGRSARPADATDTRPAEPAEAPRAGGYYDTPARKGGYVEPDFQSDHSRYYEAPSATAEAPAAESFVRPREVYEETETESHAVPPSFTPAPAPEYLYYAPATYADCRESIVQGLSDGHIVVVRLGGLEPKDILRIFDYMMGAVQALNAEFLRPEATTVVLVPDGVELDEEDLEYEDESDADEETDDEEYDDEYEEEYDDEYDDEYEEEYDEEEYEEEYEDEYEDDGEDDDADVE